MPFYDYYCMECDFSNEISHSIHDPQLTICPKCKKRSLNREFGLPHISISNEPKTLGALADRNWEKKGRYEKDSIIERDGLVKKQEQKEKHEHMTKLAKLDKKAQEAYIKHGKI